MDSDLRPSGIDELGDMSWGTHFCLFYETKNDLLDLFISFVKAGLEQNEFCLCLTSEPLIAEETQRIMQKVLHDAERYLAGGQIEITPHTDWYLKNGHFDEEHVLQAWLDKYDQALAMGFSGLRFAANVLVEKPDWDRFVHYEGKLDEALHDLRIIGLCAYNLSRYSVANILDVIRYHQFTLVRRNGTWEHLEGAALKRAHEEVVKLNAELEKRVEERTAERERLFVELQRSHEQLQTLSRRLVEVQESERKRLAREIHDDISQTLTASIMQLGTAKNMLPKSASSVHPILEQTEVLVEKTMERTRSIIADLRPPVLDDLGLVPALRRLGNELQESTDVVEVKIKTSHLPKRLPAHIEIALFRIVQEALTNIRKHARARRVDISLTKESEQLVLSVQDDGMGFEMQTTQFPQNGDLVIAGGLVIPTGHFGLIGIQERVAQLSGKLQITSSPGQGTTLRVELAL